MTLRNPNANESVEDYDKLQTAAINDNDEEIKTEIGAIKQQILTIISKLNLISDWVIESGSNVNGNYEKWNSGKLVQWGEISKVVTMNVADGSLFRTSTNITQNIPIPFVGRYETLLGLRSYLLAGIYINGAQSTNFTFYPRSTTTQTSVTIAGSFYLIGCWK